MSETLQAIPNFKHHGKEVVYKEEADELIKEFRNFLKDTSNKIGKGVLSLGDFQVELLEKLKK